jgi:hypothetical protein
MGSEKSASVLRGCREVAPKPAAWVAASALVTCVHGIGRTLAATILHLSRHKRGRRNPLSNLEIAGHSPTMLSRNSHHLPRLHQKQMVYPLLLPGPRSGH